MESNAYHLVAPGNHIGDRFLKDASQSGAMDHLLVWAETKSEMKQYQKMNVDRVMTIKDRNDALQKLRDIKLAGCVIFEKSVDDCCWKVSMLRTITYSLIYVVKRNTIHPPHLYKECGADYVIHSQNDEPKFILESFKDLENKRRNGE